MTYRLRLLTLVAIDSLIVLTTIYFSNFIIYPATKVITLFLIISSISLLIGHHVFAHIYKLYKRAWEYASIGELVAIFKAITLTIFLTVFIQFIFFQEISYRTLTITWMMHILLIGGSRFSWRVYRDTYIKSKGHKKRALIVGAGSAGTMIVRQLLKNNEVDLEPVAFIDDDAKKHHLDIMGVPVIGGIERIEGAVKDIQIDNIIIAIPSLSKRELNRIFNECTKTKAKTQILPMIEDLMLGKVSVNEFREVQVEDLLGREPVELDTENIAQYIEDQTILVTGAGGSIGSEICRQICKFSPERVVLLGHGENSIYAIELELKTSLGKSIEFITEIADVQDREKMFAVMEKHRPSVVFHAAAHKHVPLMERNPEEAVKNNILGTRNVAEAAHHHGVKTFVMISTDKAVNPTSVMGASKRIAEMIIQDLAARSMTKFVAVRFGNVLGSRGSVIPLFKEQIRRGGPVTVTHPEMVRYFMTIPEASRLVIQAGALARGGEIFVLDMGDPVKIVDLAKNLIKLSGYSIDEIGIAFTGMRPGEKLFEELLNENEVHHKQVYPKIYIGKSVTVDFRVVHELMERFDGYRADELRSELLDIGNYRKVGREAAAVAK